LAFTLSTKISGKSEFPAVESQVSAHTTQIISAMLQPIKTAGEREDRLNLLSRLASDT
jgi:hypothetical protein